MTLDQAIEPLQAGDLGEPGQTVEQAGRAGVSTVPR
jgi:hypothetical protein